MRVNLFFRILGDKQLEQKVKDIEIVRLKTLVQFKTPNGWTDPYEAIVDTGAPISLIPLSVWEELEYTKIATTEVRGIVPKPECSLPVKIGKLICLLLDKEENETQELEIYAYLASTDKVSLIIGFKDLLTKFNTCFDFRKRKAYIEE